MPSTNHHVPLTGRPDIDHTTLNAIFAQLAGAIVSYTVEGEAGATLAVRDVVYLAADGTWYQLDTDATAGVAIGRYRGVVTESGGISSAGTGEIVTGGIVSGFSGLTPWAWVYGSTTAGGVTQTVPTVSDGGAQVATVPIGIAISATEIALLLQPVVYAKRKTLSDNEELTIAHHSDAQTRRRAVFAYVGGSYDEPLYIGSLSGDAAEIGVEFGDGTGADQDTMTTFKNLTGGSADVTCLVVVY